MSTGPSGRLLWTRVPSPDTKPGVRLGRRERRSPTLKVVEVEGLTVRLVCRTVHEFDPGKYRETGDRSFDD